MPSMLEVMQSRLGIQEVKGAKEHNATIVGWAKAIGHPEVLDDETSWCSICASSAALEAGLPHPPKAINMLARSWLNWGEAVDIKDIKPGDVAIWPRGNSTWQGHVNVVETVTIEGKVICIGGNQGGLKGGDAVTRTKPLDPAGALGFRRAIVQTPKEVHLTAHAELKEQSTPYVAIDKTRAVAGGGTIVGGGIWAAVQGALDATEKITLTPEGLLNQVGAAAQLVTKYGLPMLGLSFGVVLLCSTVQYVQRKYLTG